MQSRQSLILRALTPAETIERPLGLLGLPVRDGVRAAGERVLAPRYAVSPDALGLAIGWLCRSHDVTGRRGSSKGYSLLRGWMPAYPETSGYIVGTLLRRGRRTGDGALLDRARELGDWEVEVQEPDGGIMSGAIGTRPRRSVVFNTGMVLHGWVDLREDGERRFEEPAARAAAYLADRMQADGTWQPDAEYAGIPHTYNSRVAWAMLRWARICGDERVEAAARRQLDWTLSMQRPNGWFDRCVFKPGTTPSTHGIAYTLRGLLESHSISADERLLDAVVRTSEVLIRKQEVIGHLPANWDEDWRPAARHVCLTGSVQLGGVWLRLHAATGDARFLNAGLKAIDWTVAHQERGPLESTRGALAGSFPVWGRYAPLQYPNWATKFMADALMLREDSLAALA